MLTFCRLNKINTARCNDSYHAIESWSPTDWGCAMGGECGEALNLIKKLRRITTSNPSIVSMIQTTDASKIILDIGKELADIIIYADLLATRLGLNLENCVIEKFNETSDKIKSDYNLS